jgi:hypothetical protein
MRQKIYNQSFIDICKFTILAIFTSISFGGKSQAQQTVFNVPTADVLDKGKVYVELDAAFKTNNQDALRRFSSFVPRIVVGTGKNVEIGLNITGNINPGADSTTLVPTAKWRFYQNKKKDIALFAGTNFYIPVCNRSYKFGSYSYLAAAKTIRKTRLTAGGFVFSKNVAAPKAARGGGQFAVEQTINSKLSLAADWLTGKQANGYFTSGVIYKPTSKVTAYSSYSIGNADARKGNHFFLFELGYNFN